MKRIFTIFLLLFSSVAINAQALVENFDYTAGTALTDNGWVVTATNTTNVVMVTSPGLVYAGYSGSNIGNAATLVTSGQDVYKDGGTPISSGAAYCTFLVRVDSAKAAGDYFFALLPSTSSTNFTGRAFAKTSGTGYVLGISKSTEPAAYGTTELAFGTTYLVVVKYDFATVTTTDAQCSLYVFSSGIPPTEPTTPYAGPSLGTANDAADIGRVALRQGSATNAAGVTIDGIKLSDIWETAVLPLNLVSFNTSVKDNIATFKWTTANEINVQGFTLERSKDGANFTQANYVAATNNNGNNTYEATDILTKGTTYYRLKMTDKGGAFTYSRVLPVSNKTTVALSVYPNPVVKSNLTLTHPTSLKATVQVIDMSGKQLSLYQVQDGNTQTTLNVSALERGAYVLVFTNDGEKESIIFNKN